MEAVHNYNEKNLFLPAASGVVNFKKAKASMHFSTHFHLLPYYGEDIRYMDVIESEKRVVVEASHPSLQGVLEFFICPSDPKANEPGHFFDLKMNLPTRTARTNIMTCRGDFAYQNANNTLPYMAETGNKRAPFHIAVDASMTNSNKPTNNVWKSIEMITDGTSNTMAISEAVGAESIKSRNIKGSVAFVTLLNEDKSPYTLPPSSCGAAILDTENRDLISESIPLTEKNCFRGHIFSDGRAARTGFCAILPPNSPSCGNRPADSHNGFGIWSASSYHIGGVNVGFLDGSVRFVSESIDCGNLDETTQDDGPSPYGIWGAAGTTNGAEFRSRL